MLIQLEWLKEYVDFGLSTAELDRLLSMSGLEVEAVERVELADGGKTEVMELNVTPNRGYCLSYIGVAREVAALLDLPVRLPDIPEPKKSGVPVADRIKVTNEEPELCPRYAAMVIENVTPGPSPQWLKDRLHAVGLRPINNVVDITNFVLMEYGQPLHAFDYERLAGRRIVIRRGRKGEPFTALTGQELKLDSDALVIADAEKPIALAGIMGGANSEVTLSTRTVALESAFFDPVSVRRSSKKYGLRTDSSYRFERTVDIDAVITAQSRAARLIAELGGGTLCQGRIDIYPQPRARQTILLRTARLHKILGVELESRNIRRWLERLGLEIKEQKSGGYEGKEEFLVEAPHSRPHLMREIDLIEEIARLNGFDGIAATHPVVAVTPAQLTAKQKAARGVRETLSHLGYAEVVNYSFIEEEFAEQFKTAFGPAQAETIPLSNPISEDMKAMRTSLLPGLLKTAAQNINKGQKPVKIFELGNIFFRNKDENTPSERTSFACLVHGGYEYNVWKSQGRHYDYYDLKGALETVIAQFKLTLEYRENHAPFLSPGKSMDCLVGDKPIGFLGEVSPRLGRQWDLGPNLYAFEIDFDTLVSLRSDKIRFVPIPKYPETFRDISILVDKSAPSGTIADLIQDVGKPIINRVELYDHFEGKKLGKDKKSLTFALSFQSSEKTLTDDEVNPVYEKIVRALRDKLGASLREA